MSLLDRLLVACFSVGVVLSTATQFRASAFPVGPGEALLVVWLVVNVALLVHRRRLAHPPVARVLFLFWAVAFPTLFAGTLVSFGLGVGPVGGFAHDLMAFAFASAVGLVFASAPGLEERVQRTAVWVPLITVAPLAVILAATPVFAQLGPLRPWYSVRFQGWAENPNQLALSVVAIPFVCGFFIGRPGGFWRRAVLVAIMAGSVVVGVASLSDALMASWAVGLSLVLLGGWYHAARVPSGSLARVAVLRMGVPLAALFALAVVWAPLYARLIEVVESLYGLGDQGAVRVNLWLMGIEAMLYSPVVGNGPGALSGDYAPFGGREAHNTMVDWGASTGLVGLALYVGILIWVGVRCWKRGHPMLAVCIFVLFVFSNLHYVLRHPIFWFYLVAIETISRMHAAPARAVSRPPGRPLVAAGVF